MKKYMTSIKTLAALLIVGAAFSACSSSDSNIIDEPTPVTPTTKTYKLTVKAMKGDDATRALSLSGNTLNALWAAGEKVYVYTANEITTGVYGPGESLICTLEATDVDGINCTLTGEIDPTGLSQGQKLYLQYRGGDKTGAVAPDQDGTIATISDFYDRAYAVVSITSIGTTTISTDAADFTNQQAVVKFILQDNTGSAISPDEITVTQTIGSTASDINVTGTTYTSNSNCFYIAFSSNTTTVFSGDIDISATVGSDTYTYSKSSATFTAGKFYAITVKMTKLPEGAINGKFTISDDNGAHTRQVYFSQGNLQATTTDLGTSWTWHFAENQWDYIGGRHSGGSEPLTGNNYINGNGTVLANGTVDLFGWSTSATTYGMNSSKSSGDYSGNFVDWGATMGTGWRTLSSAEWTYLFNTRTVNGGQGSGKSYTLGKYVNGKLGVVIYPDDYTGTVYAGSDWSTFEAAGCVFLPAAGDRDGYWVNNAGSQGYYWSSSPAYIVYFSSSNLDPAYSWSRHYGCSVRLVRDVQ